MKNTTLIALALTVAGVLSGCVTTNAAVLGTQSEKRPAVLPADVALYRFANQVPRRYEEIALLNSAGDSSFTDEAKMFLSMKKKAGELGANGVVLDALSEPGAGAKVAAAIFGVSAQRKGKAIAIYIFPGMQGQLPSMNTPQTDSPAQVTSTPQTNSTTQNCVACAKIGKPL